jgi:WD40 repeat protein
MKRIYMLIFITITGFLSQNMFSHFSKTNLTSTTFQLFKALSTPKQDKGENPFQPVYVASVKWSPDSNILAVDTYPGTYLYPIKNSKFGEPILLEGQQTVFSSDGTMIAAWRTGEWYRKDTDNPIQIYKKYAAKPFMMLYSQPYDVFTVAFNADDSELVSVGIDGSLVLWDMHSGEKTVLLDQSNNDEAFYAVIFGPNRSIIVAYTGYGNPVGHLTVKSREIIMLPEGGPGGCCGPTQLQLGSNTEIVTSITGFDVFAWNRVTYQELYYTFDFLTVFDPNKMLLAVNTTRSDYEIHPRLELFNLDNAGPHSIFKSSLNSFITASAFSPDGHILATVHEDHLIRFWDTNTGKVIATLKGHTAETRNLAFSPNGHFLVSTEESSLLLWDTKTHQLLDKVQVVSNWLLI